MIKNLLKWQTISSVVVFSLALIQITVLARFLELSEFGLVAIIMVVINISQVLSDLGMANYLVYKQKEVSAELNSTVFWLCVFSGWVLFIVLSALSPVIADIYDKTEILYLLPIAAFGFIPISMSAQLQARYVSNFKLNSLAKFEILARLLGTIAAISLAYKGIGAASILYGTLIANICKCILVFWKAEKSWLPNFKFSTVDAKHAWKYGVYQIGSQLINQFRGNLDILLLGFYVNNAQLGAYSLAKQLVQKPAAFVLPIVQKVSLPLLASLQKDLDNMRLVIKKAHSYVSLLLLLPYITLCFLAKPVVIIFYGLDKVEVALFVIPLALFWMLRSIGGALVGSLVQGLGKTKIDFYWNLSVLGIFALTCATFAPFGAYHLAWALAGLQFLLINVIYLVFYKKIISFRYLWFISPIVVFSTISFVSVYVSTLIVFNMFPSSLELVTIISVTSLSMLLYYLGCYYFQRGLVDIKSPKEILTMFRLKKVSRG